MWPMSVLRPKIVEFLLGPKMLKWRRRIADIRAKISLQKPEVILFYEIGDPYSHLCAQFLPKLRERLQGSVRIVVVPPAELEAAPEPLLRAAYSAIDASRIAPAWGLDFVPNPGPADQNQLDRAAAVLLAAMDIDTFLQTEPLIADALWPEDPANNQGIPENIARYSAKNTKSQLKRNQRELKRNGHYHGGMWYFRGEWFWGLDRISYLEKRLRGLGAIEGKDPLIRLDPSKAALPALESPREIDFYYSFRSPYSYIAIRQIMTLTHRYQLGLKVKPVLPMVMRGMPVNSAKRMYISQDTKREADFRGIAFGKIADPVGKGVERCLRVYEVAAKAEKELDFILAASEAIWAKGIPVDKDAGLKEVCDQVGLDWNICQNVLKQDSPLTRAEQNRKQLFSIGLWGVPSFSLGNLTVWGRDRIWLLEEALKRWKANLDAPPSD